MRRAFAVFTRFAPIVAFAAIVSACAPAVPAAPTSPPKPAATTAAPEPPASISPALAAKPQASPAVASQASPVAAASPSAAARPAAAVSAQLPPPLSPPVHVKLHLTGATVQVASYVALDRGYYAQQGLDVEVLNVTAGGGGSDIIAPLAQGQVDFAGAAPNAGMWNAVTRGLDVKMVLPQEVPAQGDRQSGLILRKDHFDSGRYTSPKDLKGMKIALSGQGSYSQWSVARFLAKVGLTNEDVSFTILPYPEMVVALANKAIDAAFEIEPNITIPEKQGISKLAFGIGDLSPASIAGALLISPVFAKNQPEAARRFVLATLQGQRDYYRAVNQDQGGKEDIYRILAKNTALTDLALYQNLGLPYYAPNGEFDNSTMEEFQDFLIKSGAQTQKVPLDKWFDRSYLDYAIGVLGRS